MRRRAHFIHEDRDAVLEEEKATRSGDLIYLPASKTLSPAARCGGWRDWHISNSAHTAKPGAVSGISWKGPKRSHHGGKTRFRSAQKMEAIGRLSRRRSNDLQQYAKPSFMAYLVSELYCASHTRGEHAPGGITGDSRRRAMRRGANRQLLASAARRYRADVAGDLNSVGPTWEACSDAFIGEDVTFVLGFGRVAAMKADSRTGGKARHEPRGERPRRSRRGGHLRIETYNVELDGTTRRTTIDTLRRPYVALNRERYRYRRTARK